MSKEKQSLDERLESMADDMMIGGESCFRAMSVVLRLSNCVVSPEQKKQMERLMRRADRLLSALHKFWRDNTDLDEKADKFRGFPGCTGGPQS